MYLHGVFLFMMFLCAPPHQKGISESFQECIAIITVLLTITFKNLIKFYDTLKTNNLD